MQGSEEGKPAKAILGVARPPRASISSRTSSHGRMPGMQVPCETYRKSMTKSFLHSDSKLSECTPKLERSKGRATTGYAALG